VLRFVRVLAPVTLWVLVAVGLALGRSQRDPGGAVWEDGRAVELTGLMVARPYPMLIVEGPESGTYLLVEEGKHGAARAAAMEGQTVRARGYVLRREGRTMLELQGGEAGLKVVGAGHGATAHRIGTETLRGEIVDSKCYLGAMKPGEGKTHKECATLCIKGGVPAVLVTEGRWYLLADASGGPIDAEVLKLVGEPVEVSGEVWVVRGVRVLRAGHVRRW
jgi:hypothetical protein